LALVDEIHNQKGFQKRTPRLSFFNARLSPSDLLPANQRKRTKDRTKQTDMDQSPSQPVAGLGWSQVGFALTFIAFNSIISQVLQLGAGASIMFAALRCVVQLTLMATILHHVFAAESFWAVVGIACKYVDVCFGGRTLTSKFDSPSFAELAWHVRNRCVYYFITDPFLLANSLGTLVNLVAIQARRRCKDMVSVSHSSCSSRGKITSSQVWCRANRDVGLDDPGVYPRSTICDARLPLLVTGTI